MSVYNKLNVIVVTPIYGGERPNCGGYVSGFELDETLKEKQEWDTW